MRIACIVRSVVVAQVSEKDDECIQTSNRWLDGPRQINALVS